MQKSAGVGSFVQQQQCVSEVTRRLRAKAQTRKVLKKNIIFLRVSLRNSSTD